MATYTIPSVPTENGSIALTGANSGWVQLSDTKFLLVYQQQNPAITYAQIMTIGANDIPTTGTAVQLNRYTALNTSIMLTKIQTSGPSTQHTVSFIQYDGNVTASSYTTTASLGHHRIIMINVDELTDSITYGDVHYFNTNTSVKGVTHSINYLQAESNQDNTLWVAAVNSTLYHGLHKFTVSGLTISHTEEILPTPQTTTYGTGNVASISMRKDPDGTIRLMLGGRYNTSTSTPYYCCISRISTLGVYTNDYLGTALGANIPDPDGFLYNLSGEETLHYFQSNIFISAEISDPSVRTRAVYTRMSTSFDQLGMIEVDTDTILVLCAGAMTNSADVWDSLMSVTAYVFHIDTGSSDIILQNPNTPLYVAHGVYGQHRYRGSSNPVTPVGSKSKMIHQFGPNKFAIFGLYDNGTGTYEIGYTVFGAA